MFCLKCGAEIPDESMFCPECGQAVINTSPNPNAERFLSEKFNMPTWKLTSGIISIILSAVVLVQSCATAIIETINGEGSDAVSGIFVMVCMLAAGIVSIVVRKSKTGKSNVPIIILDGLATLVGLSANGVYKDLIVWTMWCAACAIMAFICAMRKVAYG